MTDIRVYPQLGQTETAENGETITAAGALVAVSDFYRRKLARGSLLTYDPTGSASEPLSFSNSSVAGFATANVRQFGALGNGDQTLVSYSYTSNLGSLTYTQQTADGVGIIRALDYLRSVGGGTLYIPAGTYYVYGFLGQVDFPVRIIGDGVDVTVLKSCDAAPTNTHGYGIWLVRPGATYPEILFSDMTLDGNCSAGHRTEPTAEWICYNLALYGYPRVRIQNIKSVNSPIDCLVTQFSNDDNCMCQVSDSTFSNAWRNTISLTGGNNIQFTGCIVEKGGRVYSGHLPGYCVDVEPDDFSTAMKNTTFTNCIFRDALNILVVGTWGDVKFVGCTFDTGPNIRQQIGLTYPWLFDFSAGRYDLSGCVFRNNVNNQGFSRLEQNNLGKFAETQYVKFSGCTFDGVGMQSTTNNLQMYDCYMFNSGIPLVVDGSGNTQNAIIRNLTMVNVVDAVNLGAGTGAAFALTPGTEGYVEIDGANVRVEPSKLPADSTQKAGIDTATAYGVYFAPTLASTAEAKISNVHVAGYYQKYPVAFGHALNASFFRDWGSNGTTGTAPADTAGQTAAPGSLYYKNCTMYGNSP